MPAASKFFRTKAISKSQLLECFLAIKYGDSSGCIFSDSRVQGIPEHAMLGRVWIQTPWSEAGEIISRKKLLPQVANLFLHVTRSLGAKNDGEFQTKNMPSASCFEMVSLEGKRLVGGNILSVSIFRDAPSCFKRFNLAQVSITSQDVWVWTWCGVYSVKYDSNMDSMWQITQSWRIS